MSKRKCSFNDDLKAEFSFLSSSATDVGSTAFCNICKSTISVAHGGRSDINDHIATKKCYDRMLADKKTFKKHTFRCQI